MITLVFLPDQRIKLVLLKIASTLLRRGAVIDMSLKDEACLMGDGAPSCWAPRGSGPRRELPSKTSPLSDKGHTDTWGVHKAGASGQSNAGKSVSNSILMNSGECCQIPRYLDFNTRKICLGVRRFSSLNNTFPTLCLGSYAGKTFIRAEDSAADILVGIDSHLEAVSTIGTCGEQLGRNAAWATACPSAVESGGLSPPPLTPPPQANQPLLSLPPPAAVFFEE